MSSSSSSILIADDHALYCEGLCALISHWPEFAVIGQAHDGQEAIGLCRSLSPDIVLMDVMMPGMNGPDAVKIIKQDCPETVVVMLTVSAEKRHLITAIRHGASGYLLKNATGDQLRGCLHSALSGDVVFSESVVPSLLAHGTLTEHPDSLDTLTDREKQMLYLLAKGDSNEQIGKKLYVSMGMVKKYMSSLMQKLGLENRVQLAVYAVQCGLLEEDPPSNA